MRTQRYDVPCKPHTADPAYVICIEDIEFAATLVWRNHRYVSPESAAQHQHYAAAIRYKIPRAHLVCAIVAVPSSKSVGEIAMSGADAARPPVANPGVHIERPARVLLGWLTAQEAAQFQSGRGSRLVTAAETESAERARATVARRNGGIDQTNAVTDAPAELNDHIERLQEPAAAFFREGWRVAVVDLTKICPLQPSVFVDHAEQRTADVVADDIQSIATSTLPLPSVATLPIQFDETRQTWLVSSPNPNLRIVGNWSGPLQGGLIGLGFAVSITPSFLQVARFQGRFVLRDGYHRAYGFLQRGITRVPAFVREFAPFQDLGLPAGLLSQAAYLGDQPPTLPDYLDDALSVTVSIPAVQKMIVVTGMELTPLA